MRIDEQTAALLRTWFPTLDPAEVRIVERGPICWFVRVVLRQGAMTIAPYIFYGRARFEPQKLASVALLAHELKHIEQFTHLGRLRFLSLYLLHLARARFRYSAALPLEAEAYALQREVVEALRYKFI